MSVKELPIPSHFDPDNAANWSYSPDLARLFYSAQEWRKKYNIPPAGATSFDLQLLLVDEQKDFCFPEGTLYVGGRSGRGAIEDSRRTAEFIYRNLGLIKSITTTMDTHFAYQIFFHTFWVDSRGQPLAPYREITSKDVESGRVRPNPDMAWWLSSMGYEWLLDYVLHYTRELERTGKYTLYIWPPHCIVGSAGHTLVGVIQEARMFHSFARTAQSWVELKGDNPLTEHYSVLRPEVMTSHDGIVLAEKNVELLDRLLAADAVAIAGQAASHCVKNTLEDLLSEMLTRGASLAGKVYILSDCMSAVTVPGGRGGFISDFTEEAEEALRRFAAQGMHVVRSTEPIESWPGIRL